MCSQQRAGLTGRTIALYTAVAIGVVEVVGYGLWAGFVAAFGGGEVLLRGGITWASWIRLFFLAGPLTLLVASFIAIWSPRFGGVLLVMGGIASAVLAVLVMTPTPSTWSGGDGLVQYAFRYSMTLIIPFSLPMFLLGLWLVVDPPTTPSTTSAPER